MLSAWADHHIHTILPWSNGRLSPGDCRLSKFHNNKGTDVTADLPPLLSMLSSLSGWYCLNRLLRTWTWDRKGEAFLLYWKSVFFPPLEAHESMWHEFQAICVRLLATRKTIKEYELQKGRENFFLSHFHMVLTRLQIIWLHEGRINSVFTYSGNYFFLLRKPKFKIFWNVII